ncbi:MAG TPA: hypothetical protein VL128_12540 [Candidatus Eisenbacteria bacterium]|nr:hypothetical protein [Candidatus Eisenbacteria bacterium]
MSRGFDFDPLEMDDSWDHGSRDRSRESGTGRGGSSATSARLELQKLREKEAISDHRDMPAQNGRTATPDHREGMPHPDRHRTTYTDRDRTYSLRSSELHTLTDVGKFRVVAVKDLADLGYSGDVPRMDSDLRHLVREGLLQRRGTSALKKESQHVLTLTKQGQRFLQRHGLVPEDQTIYSGFVKPKEANHDAALYRLYQKAAGEIERKGGKVLRVQLDYELKEKLYRKLGKAQSKDGTSQRSKVAFAQEMHLPVVYGRVAFPDIRIEYANQDMEISRVDLELATGHYHAEHLTEKARAGFQIYARSEDAAGLRRVRDEREIMTAILSF